MREYLSNDEYKLYNLIYNRALQSLMADAKVNATTIIFDNNDYKFKTTGQTILFDGYLKVYKDIEKDEDGEVPKFNKGEVYSSLEIVKEQHFTQPPSRYTEAKLIKEMEEKGIGRPSTYATVVDTIKERDYVKLVDKKFVPTPMGIETTDKLQEFFSDIINVKYTANMETDLDLIAEEKEDNIKVLHEFYDSFEPLVKKAFGEMEKKAAEETGESCPECGGTIIERTSKKGKVFYGCNNYPKCDFASWDEPIDEKCPECDSILTKKGKKIKCSSCSYEK